MKDNLYRITLIGIQPNFTYSFTLRCDKAELDNKVQEQREFLQDRGMITEEIYDFKTIKL